jgi:hypothetical protein
MNIFQRIAALIFGSVLFLGGFTIGRTNLLIAPVRAAVPIASPTPTPLENVPTGFRASDNNMNNPPPSSTGKTVYKCAANSCIYDLIVYAGSQAKKPQCAADYMCVEISKPMSYAGTTEDPRLTPPADQVRDVTLLLEWSIPGTVKPH